MSFGNQFEFQHAYLDLPCLNIGCDSDSSNLKGRGCVNADIWDFNPYTKAKIPVDVIADARNLSMFEASSFRCVILGDILEHFVERADVIKALDEAWRVLQDGGHVLITCPEDLRDPVKQGFKNGGPMYCNGVRAYHAYPVSIEMIRGWLVEAGGWNVVLERHIRYPFTPKGGWGVKAVKVPKVAKQES